MDNSRNKEKREVYRSLLPHGAQVEIARKVGVSPVAISQFLSGMTNSERIENAIIEMIAEKRAERQRLLESAGMVLL